jgi:YVTN family beta-propeller protein
MLTTAGRAGLLADGGALAAGASLIVKDRDRHGRVSRWRWRSVILPVVLCMAATMALGVAVAHAGPLTPYAYVSGDRNGLAAINTATNAVVGTIPEGCGGSVATTPDGQFVYVTCNGSVQVINTSSNTVVASISGPFVGGNVGGPNQIAITPDGKYAYLTNYNDGTVSHGIVSVIDTSSNTVIKKLTVGFAATNVFTAPTGALAYVATGEGIAVIDTSTNTVVNTIPTAVIDGAFTPNGAIAYVGSVGAVSVINAASKSVVDTVAVPGGRAVWGVAVSPNGEFVYAAEEGEPLEAGQLLVISTATDEIVGTVPIDLEPRAIAITPDGALVYVTSGEKLLEGAGVSVVSTATNTVIAHVPLVGTFGVAVTPPIEGPQAPIITPPTSSLTTSSGASTNTPTGKSTGAPTSSTSMPKATPKVISAAAAFSLPSSKQCVSKRRFTIHVRTLPAITWVGATIRINHKRVKTVGRAHIKALINLVGLPKGTFVLSITAKASNGQSVTGTRTYHTCVPKLKSHYPAPKL